VTELMAVVRIGVAAFIFFSSFERQLRIAGLPFIFFKCFFNPYMRLLPVALTRLMIREFQLALAL
jgi:hypothetical protein